jgi:hypothetical protein
LATLLFVYVLFDVSDPSLSRSIAQASRPSSIAYATGALSNGSRASRFPPLPNIFFLYFSFFVSSFSIAHDLGLLIYFLIISKKGEDNFEKIKIENSRLETKAERQSKYRSDLEARQNSADTKIRQLQRFFLAIFFALLASSYDC